MFRRTFMCTAFMRWVYGCLVLSVVLMYLIYDAYITSTHETFRRRPMGHSSMVHSSMIHDNLVHVREDGSTKVTDRPTDIVRSETKAHPDEKLIDGILHTETINGVEILGEVVTERKYAVYGAATQQGSVYTHAFYLPLTAKAWRRVGYHSIVILIGSIEHWYADRLSQHILSHLRAQNATVVFLQTTPQYEVMMSQVSRIFVSSLLQNHLPGVGDPYLVTSDADIWPLDAFMYELPGDKLMVSLNSECCGRFQHHSRQYKMLPMANIGMRLRTWVKVVKGPGLNPTGPTDIVRYLYQEFGDVALHQVQKGDNLGWYLDQHTVSFLIQDYLDSIGNHEMIRYVPRDVGRDRLDRSGWDPRSFGEKADVHLPNDPFLSRIWGRILPLLNIMYTTDSDVDWCIHYFQTFQTILLESK